jgi:hypothetical protein
MQRRIPLRGERESFAGGDPRLAIELEHAVAFGL